jgi:hypothetical protein
MNTTRSLFQLLVLLFYTSALTSCTATLIETRYQPVKVFSGKEESLNTVNAISFEEFKSMVSRRPISGHFLFQKGIYNLAGELEIHGRNLTIEGAREATFKGDGHQVGGIIIGGEDIVLKNLKFIDTSYCIKNSRKMIAIDILISGLNSDGTHDCIILNGRAGRKVDQWVISRFLVSGYYRSAIRVFGDRVSNVNIDGFDIDGSSEKSYCWKGGIQIYESAHKLSISNGVIRNNHGGCGNRFQQGDGVEIDHKRGVPEDIIIKNIAFENNRDADVDVKGKNVTMENLIFFGGTKSRHAIKAWARSYTCLDCYATRKFFKLVEAKDSTINFSCSVPRRVEQLYKSIYNAQHTTRLECISLLLNTKEAT